MATTVTESIGTASRDYSTISGWEAATDNDLVTADEVRVGECYNDSVFDELFSPDGATTDATRHRVLTVAEGERHDGTAGTGARIELSDNTPGANPYRNFEDYFEIRWLEFTPADPSSMDVSNRVVIGTGSNDLASNLIVHDWRNQGAAATLAGITHWDECGGCVVYDMLLTGSTTSQLNCYGFDRIGVLRNGTVDRIESQNSGSGAENAWGVRNCDSVENCVAIRVTAADNNPCFDNNTSESNNASDDGTGGAGVVTAGTSDFESVTDGSEDYHLASGSALIDAGLDPGDAIGKIDIDGGDRHAEGVTWDIGADEDGLGESTTFDTDIAEAMSFDDTISGILEMSEDVGESFTLDDALTSVKVIAETLQEDTVFADTVEALFEFGGSVTEDMTVTDVVTASMIVSAAIAEGMTFDDAVNLLFDTEVSEGVTVGDVFEAITEVGGTHTEASGIGDQYEVTVSAAGTLRTVEMDATIRDGVHIYAAIRDEVEGEAEIKEEIKFYAPFIGE